MDETGSFSSAPHRSARPASRWLWAAGAALGMLLPGVAGPAHAQCQYSVTVILGPECPPFGFPPIGAEDVTELGAVVGTYRQCTLGADQAYVWTAETGFSTLQLPPGAQFAKAAGANDQGMIVGTWSPDGVAGQQAFLWQAGEWLTLPPAGNGIFSGATAINNTRQIVGHRELEHGTPRAFFWEEGIFTDIATTFGTISGAEGLNEAGVVVGWMGNGTFDRHAFVWQDGLLVDLGPIPGGITSVANAVNSGGDVVGSGIVSSPGGQEHLAEAFLWSAGEMTNLGTLHRFPQSTARDINDHRTIVGFSGGGKDNIVRAFVWQNGVMYDLNDLIPEDAGVLVRAAVGVNNSGQIAAVGQVGATAALLLTPVEAPLGDVDGDCHVGLFDFTILLEAWGQADSPADLNQDGVVGIVDFLILLANWSES